MVSVQSQEVATTITATNCPALEAWKYPLQPPIHLCRLKARPSILHLHLLDIKTHVPPSLASKGRVGSCASITSPFTRICTKRSLANSRCRIRLDGLPSLSHCLNNHEPKSPGTNPSYTAYGDMGIRPLTEQRRLPSETTADLRIEIDLAGFSVTSPMPRDPVTRD